MMLTEGRHPFGVVLDGADSRVPPESIFDFGLGDLFVIRVAGNVVANDEAGSSKPRSPNASLAVTRNA